MIPEKKPNAFLTFLKRATTLPMWGLIAIVLVALLLGHVTGGGNSATNSANVSTSTVAAATPHIPSATKTPAPTATPKPAPRTVTIASFSGSTTKNTATFHVDANEWTLAWACQGGQFGGNLSLDVDKSDGSSFDLGAVNIVCNGSMHDSTIERKSGDFYLAITADVDWQITITAVQ